MTTGTITRCDVDTKWETSRIQQEAAVAVTSTMAIATRLLCSSNPGLLAQLRVEWAKAKVSQLRRQGVRTPIELARAWSEYETNLFGSKIRYWGDENEAHVEYEVCGCWSALEAMTVSESEQNAMSDGWSQMTRVLAQEFGFTGSEKLATNPDEAPCTISFVR